MVSFLWSLTVAAIGFGGPWLFVEDSWRYPMMVFSAIMGAVLYIISFIYARRAYFFYENSASKKLRGFHVCFFIATVVMVSFFLVLAHMLWTFSGFAPYQRKPFWIWLLG